LKANNGKIFLGAFGTDYYYTKACLDGIYRYSDFHINDGDKIVSVEDNLLWTLSPLKDLNISIAQRCDGIIACLYEYYKAYELEYSNRLAYIPLPINTRTVMPTAIYDGKVRFFIGVQRAKMRLKGSDIMLDALNEVVAAYPHDTTVYVAESLPYAKYTKAMCGCNLLVDQLYSYTPGMNALLGMAKGMVVAGGGEDEMYDILGEHESKPIINLLPEKADIIKKFRQIIATRETLQAIGEESRSFIEKHHYYISVAEAYVKFWEVCPKR
ncbi:MAG: glycosyltransferase family 1 protein, partial [Bacteroidales bacterium]